MSRTVVIDYGLSNIKNVRRALEKVGASTEVSSCPEAVLKAERLVLPGVGSFENGMMGLESLGLIEPIIEFTRSGRPLLGICLGMQMLLSNSGEYGYHQGLGLVEGAVKPIRRSSLDLNAKVPNIGWRTVRGLRGGASWEASCLERHDTRDAVYFVHSYMAEPLKDKDVLAVCDYGGVKVTAAVKRDNITGLQFHPEKSGRAGLKILEEFLNV
jgi:glutamine amidotransferase